MASISARIRCEIEVEVGFWNGKQTFDDLHQQVVREGENIVHAILGEQGRALRPKGRLVPGTAVVKFVVVTEGERE